MNITFGTFVRDKRVLAGLSLRQFASELNVSPVYISNIERGKRSAPHGEIIRKMVDVLCLSDKDRDTLYDLAAYNKNNTSAPYDISCYINDHTVVRNAIRLAQKNEVSEDKWLAFIKDIS